MTVFISFSYIALASALLILSISCSSYAEFTNDFRAFIHNRYGLEIVNQLERRDLGADASLGGKDPQEEQSLAPNRQKREAVLIVHGITNKITRFNVSCWDLSVKKRNDGHFLRVL